MTTKNVGGLDPLEAATLRKTLNELATRRQRLDALDTGISDAITLIQEALRKHVSIRISTDISEPPVSTLRYLSFGKHSGTWQLLVESEYGDETDTTPLMSCSRETRLEMFTKGHVQTLIVDAVAQIDKQIAEREKGLKIAQSLADALTTGGKP